MLKALKIIGIIFVLLPVLFLAQCVYRELSKPAALQEICAGINTDSSLESIIGKARQEGFEYRSKSYQPPEERDWSNRTYDSIVTHLAKDREKPADYLVIFAKPGMGYYACIIEYDGGFAKTSRYIDRSS